VVNYNVGKPEKNLQTWFGGIFNTFHPILSLHASSLQRRKQSIIADGQEAKAISTVSLETFEASTDESSYSVNVRKRPFMCEKFIFIKYKPRIHRFSLIEDVKKTDF